MLDVGLSELILIFAIALIVFGPKKLPELGRNLGKLTAQLKRSMTDIKTEVNRELYSAERKLGGDELFGPPQNSQSLRDRVNEIVRKEAEAVESALKSSGAETAPPPGTEVGPPPPPPGLAGGESENKPEEEKKHV